MGRRISWEAAVEGEEPLTPAGRFFLHPDMQNVIHCVVGMKLPIQIDSMKAAVGDTLLKHPRFSSLVVRDKQGRERWKKTEVDLDKHFIFPKFDSDKDNDSDDDNHDDGEEFVNRYLADMAVSTPLDESKPLWEIHLLEARRVCVLRLHHALGDGISLMSLFLACCNRAGDPGKLPALPRPALPRPAPVPARGVGERLLAAAAAVWWNVVYIVEFVMRSLWVKDEKTGISGGAGVELWPRKAATASFKLDDMKVVKNAVNGTINDVLIAVIATGIRKYLEMQSPQKSSKPLRITGLALVNTRLQPGLHDVSEMLKSGSEARWGNEMGYVTLPVCLDKRDEDDPLACVRRNKKMLDRKKHSLEAYFSYRMGALVMSLFGPKLATLLNYRIIANTTFTISNVVGPQEEIMFAENPIKFLRATSTSIPHALTMHMVSYMGKAELQVLVAKDIIEDPKLLARCFQDSLQEMVKAAAAQAALPASNDDDGKEVQRREE